MKKLEFLIPPPIYLFIFIFIILWASKTIPLSPHIDISPYKELLLGSSILLFILGMTLDLFSVFLFMNKKTTVNPLRPQRTEKMVVTGFYRYTRNPMYLGQVFILVSIILWEGNFLLLPLIPIFMFLITTFQIKPEEKILLKKFGNEYKQYKQKVNRWL